MSTLYSKCKSLIRSLIKYHLFIIGSILVIFHYYQIVEFSKFLYHEIDARWWLPLIEEKTFGLSWEKILGFVFTPQKHLGYAHVYVKLQPYLITKLIGNTPTDFIFVSLFFHLITSLFLYFLCRQLKFDIVTSVVSGVLHFSFFNHFHAYVYSIAFQHILVMFFVVIILYLYFKTNKIFSHNGKYKSIYIITLFMMLLSSMARVTILIIPIIILFDIIFKRENDERKKYYRLWLPSFIIYLLYQSYFLSIVGDDQLTNIGLMIFSKMHYPTNFIGLSLIGSIIISIGYYLIDLSYMKRKIISQIFFIGFLIFIFLKTNITYWIYPVVNFLYGFFMPINLEMSTNSAIWYHKLITDLNLFFIILSLIVILQYIRMYKNDPQKLILIFGTYILYCITFPRDWQAIDSRYFIFISPFLIVLVVSFLISILNCIGNSRLRQTFVVLLLLILSLQSTKAVNISMFRGKLTHTMHIYDYAKVVNTVSQNLIKKDNVNIYIKNLPYLPLKEELTTQFLGHKFNNVEIITLKYILEQKLPNVNLIDLNFDGVGSTMNLDYSTLVHSDVFHINYTNAMNCFKSKDYNCALRYVNKAIDERPFLINYLLGISPDDYLQYLTDRMSLREWLRMMRQLHSWSVGGNDIARQRVDYLTGLMNSELDYYQEVILLKIFLMYDNLNDNDISWEKINVIREYIAKLSRLDVDIDNLEKIIKNWPISMDEKHKLITLVNSYQFHYLFYLSNNYHNVYQFGDGFNLIFK